MAKPNNDRSAQPGRHANRRPEPSREHVRARDGGGSSRRARSTHSAPPPARNHRSARSDGKARGHRGSEGTPGLGRTIGWTIAGGVLPGTGLITTRLRKLGVTVFILAALAAAVAFVVIRRADLLDLATTVLSSRTILAGVGIGIVAVFLVWAIIVLLTSSTQARKWKLGTGRASIASAIALVLVGTVAVPVTYGVRAVEAQYSLLGSETFVSPGGSDISQGEKDPWANADRLNILMLGQDEGADRTGTRPDTIMVASIDPQNGKTALFSIPRNLQYVHFPEGTKLAEKFPEGFDAYGSSQNLINAVWQYGEENPDLLPGSKNPGLDATVLAVEQTLGLKIDNYAMVNLQGFEDIITAIGGVKMDVERKIPIGGGEDLVNGGTYPVTGYIEPGEQTLTGSNALWYVRSRWQSSDWDRICRQQRFIREMSQQVSAVTIATAYSDISAAVQKNVTTDVPTDRIDDFAKLGIKVAQGGISSYPITKDVAAGENGTGPGSPDWDYIHSWVQESIEASDPPAQSDEPAPQPTTSEEPSETDTSTTEEPEPEPSTSQTPEDPLASCMPGSSDPDAEG